MSRPPFFLRDSRAGETRARVKITPREKRRHAEGREKNEGRRFEGGEERHLHLQATPALVNHQLLRRSLQAVD